MARGKCHKCWGDISWEQESHRSNGKPVHYSCLTPQEKRDLQQKRKNNKKETKND